METGIPGGALVVSLDFELHWGVRDIISARDFRPVALETREVIPAILRLFESFGVHATWATVGFLFCATKRELLSRLPVDLPRYRADRLSPYPSLDSIGDNEDVDPLHFAPSLIRTIRKTQGQEIGTHTFSHFYCNEGASPESFAADLQSAIEVACRLDVRPTSIVFPRNQIAPPLLGICARSGISAYRGNPATWGQPGAKWGGLRTQYNRGIRLIESYISVRDTSSCWPDPMVVPANVAASRFLRPPSRFADALIVGQVCRELTGAAKAGRIYHLWWHPHNFGRDSRRSLLRLETILEHFSRLRGQYGMESLSMAEVVRESRLGRENG